MAEVDQTFEWGGPKRQEAAAPVPPPEGKPRVRGPGKKWTQGDPKAPAPPEELPAERGERGLEMQREVPRENRGGLKRPWAVEAVPRVDERALDVECSVWEGGLRTTFEVKREIIACMHEGYSLVQIIESRRAEHPNHPRWWPTLQLVVRWAERDPELAGEIVRFSRVRAMELAEKIQWEAETATMADMAALDRKWKTLAWILERLDPEKWVPKIRVESTVKIEDMSKDELDSAIADMLTDPMIANHANKLMASRMERKTLPGPGAPEPPIV